MLSALMDGRAWTAKELAAEAGISASTASAHLAKLLDGGFVHGVRQGRHHYFRLKSPGVAGLLEQMMQLRAVEPQARHRPPSRLDAETRFARICYDHLAGQLGVALTHALVARGYVSLDLPMERATLTPKAAGFLASLGIEPDALVGGRRVLCRPCLDWSERAPHLAGALGAGLATCFIDRGWVVRRRVGRSVKVSEAGWAALEGHFGLTRAELDRAGASPVRWA